jgi:hypothetical protein
MLLGLNGLETVVHNEKGLAKPDLSWFIAALFARCV